MPGCVQCLARMPTGRIVLAFHDSSISTTEACTGRLIVRQASYAGGSGARCAPGGEREGQSRLAYKAITNVKQQGARGAQPARMKAVRNVEQRGARGAA